MKKIVVFFLINFLLLSLNAQTKVEADSAYIKGDYKTAISIYESLLDSGVNKDLYYNLGNSYYRINEIPKAVLNYNRALKLAPGDEDVSYNLALCNTKIMDFAPHESSLWVVNWFTSLVNKMNADGWAKTALSFFVLTIVAFLVYYFSKSYKLQKSAFISFIVLGIFVVCFNIFAFIQARSAKSNYAILMQDVTIKSTPSSTANGKYNVRGGNKVEVLDMTLKGWYQVLLNDGTKGWVEDTKLEII